MKPRPRIRKTVKWGGLALTVLLVAAWIVGQWWDVSWFGASGFGVQVGGNTFGAAAITDPQVLRYTTPGWTVRAVTWPVRWWVYFDRRGTFWVLAIPLWMPVLVCAGVSACAWRLDVLARRRARAGMCPACNYNLAGLPRGAVCPECGGAAAARGVSS